MKTAPEWISAIAAILALVVSAFAIWSARRAEAHTRRLQEKSAELAAWQTKLDERTWTDAYFREVTSWASTAAQAISRAIHLPSEAARGHPDVEALLSEISAAIDTGRWYFPNQSHTEMGLHKQPAYRGARQPILDQLVGAYNALSKLTGRERYQRLVEFQRCFVSEVQLVLDPHERDTVITKVLEEFFQSERIRALKAPK